MGYETLFTANIEFEILERRPVELALNYFSASLNNMIKYEINNNIVEMNFDESWKNQNAFFEDVLRTIEKYSTILNCEILEEGEEINDRKKWFLEEGKIKIAPLIKKDKKEVSNDEIASILNTLSYVAFEITSYENNTDDADPDEFNIFVENIDAKIENKKDEILNYLKNENKQNYLLSIDLHGEVAWEIECKNGVEKFYKFDETIDYDDVKSLDEIIRGRKMFNEKLNQLQKIYNNSFMSDMNENDFLMVFEDGNGYTLPFYPTFLEQFHIFNKRGEVKHTFNGEEVSICDFCINRMKQKVNGCRNCFEAELAEKPKKEIKLQFKK